MYVWLKFGAQIEKYACDELRLRLSFLAGTTQRFHLHKYRKGSTKRTELARSNSSAKIETAQKRREENPAVRSVEHLEGCAQTIDSEVLVAHEAARKDLPTCFLECSAGDNIAPLATHCSKFDGVCKMLRGLPHLASVSLRWWSSDKKHAMWTSTLHNKSRGCKRHEQ